MEDESIEDDLATDQRRWIDLIPTAKDLRACTKSIHLRCSVARSSHSLGFSGSWVRSSSILSFHLYLGRTQGRLSSKIMDDSLLWGILITCPVHCASLRPRETQRAGNPCLSPLYSGPVAYITPHCQVWHRLQVLEGSTGLIKPLTCK